MSKLLSIVGVISFALLGCGTANLPFEPVAKRDPIPNHDTFTIESTAVGETRVICVWKPPEYVGNQKFPVLYMPDGGIKEDFPHIANSLAKLVDDGSIPPMILVGIENTERRRDLTGPSKIADDAKIAPITDGSSKFRAFIANELFSEIDRRYRTTDQRSIIGESAAGLFVVETLLLKPEMFENYIAMDPAIYWNDRYLVRSAIAHLSNSPNSKRRFWFAGSAAIDIQPNTRELKSILEEHASDTLDWRYSDQPGEQHKTIFRATKEAAIKWTFRPDGET
ncbi:MAG: alpha/beta hydrolase-fold protein [Planctomycetota bacterium]